MHIRLLPCVAGLLAVGALLVAFPVPGDSFRTLHASDRCAEVVRRGQSLKPRGGGRGWSQKYDDLDDCLSLCTTGYKYVVENQSTGTCYCWRSGSDYRWSDDTDNDQVHDVSDCQESSSVASRERDGYGGSTRAGELDECVDVSHHRTLKPSGGGRGWSLKYDDLSTCLSRCKRDDGYMHIVENTQTGQCYCYHIDEGNNYRWSDDDDDIGSDVLYNIATCFQLPKLDCPRDDEPGWIDQPKDMRCKEYYGNKFKLRRGYEYINYAGKRMSYDGSMGHCKTLCYAVIIGDLEIPTPIWCKAVEYDEDDGDCTMYGGCRELEDHRDGQVSVYCGVT